MHNILLYASLLLAITDGFGQKKQKQTHWQYANLNSVSALKGSSGGKAGFQTIHGIEKKSWMLGIGAGIDDYGVPGFPLFGHGQKSFTHKTHKPLVYLQLGTQFGWKKGEWKKDENNWQMTDIQLNNGFIGEAGIGYSFKLGKNYKLQISTGYSYKSVKGVETGWLMLSTDLRLSQNLISTSNLHFQYHRIALRVGFGF